MGGEEAADAADVGQERFAGGVDRAQLGVDPDPGGAEGWSPRKRLPMKAIRPSNPSTGSPATRSVRVPSRLASMPLPATPPVASTSSWQRVASTREAPSLRTAVTRSPSRSTPTAGKPNCQRTPRASSRAR